MSLICRTTEKMVDIEAHAWHTAQRGDRQVDPWNPLPSHCSPIGEIHSMRDTLTKEVDYVPGWMIWEVYSGFHISMHTCTEIHTYIYICTSCIYAPLCTWPHTYTIIYICIKMYGQVYKPLQKNAKKCQNKSRVYDQIHLIIQLKLNEEQKDI